MGSLQDRGGIFISYRREDTAAQAGRLYDHLSERFGENLVFMDVEAIAVGTDFIESLVEAVSRCDVLIVLIGRNWLTVNDNEGRRRIDNSDDWVRVEVEAALQRDILVAPVLVDGAALPLANNLPQSLQPLIRRQALELTHASFRSQVKVLITAIEEAFGVASTAPTMTRWLMKLREQTDTKSTFRLWRGKETHEITITLGMATAEIYVDGEFVTLVTSLTGQEISLRSCLKTEAVLQAREVETGRYVTGATGRKWAVRRIEWLKVTIGADVLKYPPRIPDKVVEVGEAEVIDAELADDWGSGQVRSSNEDAPGRTSKETEWRLNLMSDKGAKKTFRLSSYSETHEIIIRIAGWKDIIEVDGERVAETGTTFKTLSFREIPLTTLGANLGTPVVISVRYLDDSNKKYCLTLKIGDQVLSYSTQQYNRAWTRRIQRELRKKQQVWPLR